MASGTLKSVDDGGRERPTTASRSVWMIFRDVVISGQLRMRA